MAKATTAQTRRNDGRTAALAGLLADTYLLMGKTQVCHWNVTGPNFAGLHDLFETQYRELFEAVDAIAERIRALDAMAPASVREMMELSALSEPDAAQPATDMVRMLAQDHRALSESAAELADTADEEDDLATHDMLVTRIAAHDKAAWMLRSHLA